jgi:crescentin
MSTISKLFVRKQIALAAVNAPTPAAPEAAVAAPQAVEERSAAEKWADVGLKVGGDNEVLRHLLMEVGRRVDGLDDLRETFGKLIGPLDQTLQNLERETFDNVNLRGTIEEAHSNYIALRNEFKELGHKLAVTERDCEQLRVALGASQQAVEVLESRKTELTTELEPARARLAELERQLARETAAGRLTREHNQSLTETATAAGKRIAELEGDIGTTREKLALREDESRSLQSSLDHLVGENSRLSRSLIDSEAAVEKMRLQIEQVQASLATAEAERHRLAAALDDAVDKWQIETNTLSTRLDAMSSRAVTAEKLLAEVRQSLLTRTEESTAAERKVVEATLARNLTDKKLEVVQNALATKERQFEELEQTRAKLVERANSLLKTVKLRDSALARAEQRMQTLTGRIADLEAEIEANRVAAAESMTGLKSELQNERAGRSVAEGALRKARLSYADAQRELDYYVRHYGPLGHKARTRARDQVQPPAQRQPDAEGHAQAGQELPIVQGRIGTVPDDLAAESHEASAA